MASEPKKQARRQELFHYFNPINKQFVLNPIKYFLKPFGFSALDL